MKKFSLLILTLTIFMGVHAQTDSLNIKMNLPQSSIKSDNYHADGYMMKDGKMVIVKDGTLIQMEKDVTLSNGTVIMKNGTYQKKNGTKTTLKEGEHIDMMGNTTKKDMYLIPDSTRKKKH